MVSTMTMTGSAHRLEESRDGRRLTKYIFYTRGSPEGGQPALSPDRNFRKTKTQNTPVNRAKEPGGFFKRSFYTVLRG